MSEPTIAEALATAAEAFADMSESAKLDAEVLLLHVLGKTRSYLFTWPDKTLSAEQFTRFQSLCEKRKAGHPVAHLTGLREFWSLPLEVNATTLIPRPDTETLVETVLQQNYPDNSEVLDLGTGTGAIALALASEKPNWRVTAVDRVADAVSLCERNRKRLGLDNVEVCQSDWFSALQGRSFDIIVSNPPYIDECDPHLEQGDVVFEPRSALVADEKGMADIKQIIESAREHLKPGGLLAIEHGYDQAQLVSAFFLQMAYNTILTIKDLGGNDRVTMAQWNG